MILTDLRNYIKENHPISLNQLAVHFDMDAESLLPLLEHWEHKGVIQKKVSATSCSGCSGCKHDLPIIYDWANTRSET